MIERLDLKLQKESNKKNIVQHVIEKDYALSYVLAGIAEHEQLRNSLVFKGGTAIKMKLMIFSQLN